MSKPYRPWGPLQWLVSRLPQKEWDFLGVLGTEDRCTASYEQLRSSVKHHEFWLIEDPNPTPAGAFASRYQVLKDDLVRLGASPDRFSTAELLENIDTIREKVDAFVSSSNGAIVLDISSMPKWWFFPATRFLLQDARVRSLIITYASAVSYGDQLSSDLDQLAPLPTYDEHRVDEFYAELIIGVGFAPLGLKDMYEKDIGKIRYLFPFPPGPPNFFRNWQFLRSLDEEVENRNLTVEDRWLVHMYDVPSAFDALARFTKRGERSSALAPFGPKTLSLAMCLFALAAEKRGCEPVHAFYTQPRRYALDYSTGIKIVNGLPDIKAYVVKWEGESVYQL